MFLKLILLTIGMVSIAFAFMAVKIIVLKGGKFPKSGVGHSPALRKMDIHCVKHEELKCHRKRMIEMGKTDCDACEAC
jgi:hypothetical protein